MSCESPLLGLPRLQATVAEPVHLIFLPPAPISVIPEGRVSATVTSVAAAAPELRTVSEYVTAEPTVAGSGRSLSETARSAFALGVGIVSDAAFEAALTLPAASYALTVYV